MARFDEVVPRAISESSKAYQACADYCMMGSARSLRKLLQVYKSAHNHNGEQGIQSGYKAGAVPTVRLSTLTTWSSAHDWTDRALAWDAALVDEDALIWQERRKQVKEREWEAGEELARRALSNLVLMPMDGKGGIVSYAIALDTASKLLRRAAEAAGVASDLPQGAVLDTAIERELARMADSPQASTVTEDKRAAGRG